MNKIKSIFAKYLFRIDQKIKSFLIRGKNIIIRQKTICGANSKFYEQSSVENLQNKAKLKIGNNSHVRGELFVYPYGDGITIGNDCYIGVNSVVRSGSRITIGNSVLIAHNVTIIDSDSHEIDAIERDKSFKNLILNGHPPQAGMVLTAPIKIEDHVWISYNACILKGVTIGKGAIVGAGSVVTKNVPAWTLVAGNPAKVIKSLPH